MGIMNRFSGRFAQRKAELIEARDQKRAAMAIIRKKARAEHLRALEKETLKATRIRAREIVNRPSVPQRAFKAFKQKTKEIQLRDKSKDLFEIKKVI